MTHSALCRHTCRPNVGRGRGGWTIIRATWSGITPRYIWLGEKICVAENLKPFTSGIGLLNYCIEVAVNEKCDFSRERMSITGFDEARSPKSVRIEARVRSLAANQCRSNRIVSTTAMEFHDAFHDLKCESYLSFFFFYFPFISFFCLFVRLFVCLSLVFFSFFIDENFHFAFREECLDLFLMPVALYINWILRSRIKRKRGYVRGIFRFCEIKNKKATRVVVF